MSGWRRVAETTKRLVRGQSPKQPSKESEKEGLRSSKGKQQRTFANKWTKQGWSNGNWMMALGHGTQKWNLFDKALQASVQQFKQLISSHKPSRKSWRQPNQQIQEVKLRQFQFYRINAGSLQQLCAETRSRVATWRYQRWRTQIERAGSISEPSRLFYVKARWQQV